MIWRYENRAAAKLAELIHTEATAAADSRFERQTYALLTNTLTLYKDDEYKALTNPLFRALLDDITVTSAGREAFIKICLHAYTLQFTYASKYFESPLKHFEVGLDAPLKQSRSTFEAPLNHLCSTSELRLSYV